MDDEKKRRLYELASKEAYEQGTQNNEPDSDNTDYFNNEAQTDSDKEQIYETGQKLGQFLYQWKEALIVVGCMLILILLILITSITSCVSSSNTEDSESIQSELENSQQSEEKPLPEETEESKEEKPEEEPEPEEPEYNSKEILNQYEADGITIVPMDISILADYYNEYTDQTIRTVIVNTEDSPYKYLYAEHNNQKLEFYFDDNRDIQNIAEGETVEIVGTVSERSTCTLKDCQILAVNEEADEYQKNLSSQADNLRSELEAKVSANKPKAEASRKEWKQYCDAHQNEIIVATPEDLWENHEDYEGKLIYTAFYADTISDTNMYVDTANRDSWLMWSVLCEFENPNDIAYIESGTPVAVIGTAEWMPFVDYMVLNDSHIVDIGDNVEKSMDSFGGQSVSDHLTYKLFKEFLQKDDDD